jgi:putative transposase
MKSEIEKFRSKDLRKGRVSISGQPYHVIATTLNRTHAFSDFSAARCVVRALRQSDASRFTSTFAFVIMPDHVHWLFSLQSEDLSKVVARVKSAVSRSMSAGSTIWQAGFYDHAVRRDESIEAIAAYIVNNPVRAKLVDRIEDYSHWYLSSL